LLVGGKAASLGTLCEAGFRVPPGLALSTRAFREHLEAAGLTLELQRIQRELASGEPPPYAHQLKQLREELISTPLSEALQAELRAQLTEFQLLEVPLAVRSSGTQEDLEGASFAGQYQTLLNVRGFDAVTAAVRQCWASLFESRVLEYLRHRGAVKAELSMGVVVQQLVPSELSGVLFTLNPLTGREGEAVVEAVFGLGESLVGGKVNGDRFVLRDGQVVTEEISHQAMEVISLPQGGTEELPLGEAQGSRRTLTVAQLVELSELAAAIQEDAGRPMDVEWAYAGGQLFVLQSRPITKLHFQIEGEWTTADFKDGGVSSDVCSPFMWSLYELSLERSFSEYFTEIKLLKKRAPPVKWGRMFFARPYWNMGQVKELLLALPGFNERSFDTDLGVEVDYEGPGRTTGISFGGLLSALPVLFALEKSYKERLESAQRWVAAFARAKEPYELTPEALSALSPSHFAGLYRALIYGLYYETESRYFCTIYNTSNSKLDFKVQFEKANAAVGGDLDYLKLVGGLKNLSHLRPMIDLHKRLLGLHRAGGKLDDRMVASFARSWRHHSRKELDIRVPRWDEDHPHVRAMLEGALASFRPDDDPEGRESSQHAEYLAERERAIRALGPIARRSFAKKLDRVRAYAWWREELRDHSSYAYYLVRRWTLEAAFRLAKSKAIADADDIWYLPFQEVCAALAAELPAPALRQSAAAGRRMVRSFRHFKNPNEVGGRYRFDSAGAAPVSDGALRGTACSPGRVEGRARVVTSLEDTHRLEKGDILVTPFTDPGWTPVFPRIAAVVTETGGLLSHAAVISREYGIPAVLAVKGATQVIRDGDQISVDGSQGAVEVLRRADS
jgi:phosphohistidine swiveling domain-containing protein